MQKKKNKKIKKNREAKKQSVTGRCCCGKSEVMNTNINT